MRFRWRFWIDFRDSSSRHRQVTDLDVTVLGFSGPGLPSARQVLCGDAPRLFFYHISVHLNGVFGRTELCHEVWTPGPQKPQIISNENHHLALLPRGEENLTKDTTSQKGVLDLPWSGGPPRPPFLWRTSETISISKMHAACLQFPNAVVLNSVGHRNTQMSAKERKRAQKICFSPPESLAIPGSEGSKPVRIRTYLHERPQKTKTDMYKFAPRSPRL